MHVDRRLESITRLNAVLPLVTRLRIESVRHPETLAIVLAGSHAQAWLADPARTKWVRRGFAVVMLGVAASFLAFKSA